MDDDSARSSPIKRSSVIVSPAKYKEIPLQTLEEVERGRRLSLRVEKERERRAEELDGLRQQKEAADLRKENLDQSKKGNENDIPPEEGENLPEFGEIHLRQRAKDPAILVHPGMKRTHWRRTLNGRSKTPLAGGPSHLRRGHFR